MACITKDKKPGQWCIDFYDQYSRRRLKVLPKGTTKKQAKKVLAAIEGQVERGVYIPKVDLPTFSRVAQDWLRYKRPNLRESTYGAYEGHIHNHLDSHFGHIVINRINFDSIEKYMDKAVREGVTPPTLKKILITLGGILKYATRKRYIDFNPSREIDKPKGNGSAKENVNFLKPPEIRIMIENTEGQKYKVLFKLAVMSGMREGELLGLKWTDIDWFNSQVHVKRTFNHGRFYEPKSEASRRCIDLGPSVISELKKWQLACLPNELDLIFPNAEGNPMDCMNLVKRHFHPALRRAGLRRIRFHDLRHTYAALLIDQGEHPKYIQRQMGHSSIKVTMDTYGHLMEKVNPEASKRLDETVFGKNGDQMETKAVFEG